MPAPEPASADPAGRARVALLFTQQTIGLGARKTSMIFLAEALRNLGFDVWIVTVQLSWLTHLGARERLERLPRRARNRWYDADGMHGFVWVPVAHPVRVDRPWLNRLTGPFVASYGHLLPAVVRNVAGDADVIVIESCAAVALTRTLRTINADARYIYNMSDRLDVVGMHPALQHILQDDAANYDLIRVPAAAMVDDLPTGNVVHIAHGLDKRPFDAPSASPYGAGRHAILAGDMMLDQPLLVRLSRAFPDVDFHYFGRVALAAADIPENLHAHGEVPFAVLAPYIVHADVGLALYRELPGLDYLAQSSLKNLQYLHCRLPVVAPHFIAASLAGAYGYEPGQPDTALHAMAAALSAGRQPAPASHAIASWEDVATTMLRLAGTIGSPP